MKSTEFWDCKKNQTPLNEATGPVAQNRRHACSMDDLPIQSEQPFPTLNTCREQLEKTYLTQLLKQSNGSRKTACRLAGISQARLYALLKKYDLPGFAPSR